ncbi:MAG TPA: PKD domain-containing protein [Abditibacteriaceae bacterium]|jgi:hypothetical protein
MVANGRWNDAVGNNRRFGYFVEFSVPNATAIGTSPSPESAASVEVKTVLVIRLDFEDHPGEPISEENALKVMEDVSLFIEDNSAGGVKLASTVTPLLRAPPTGDVGTNARAAAKTAGFDAEKFDLYVVAYTDSPMARASGGIPPNTGFGAIGGKGLKVNSGFYPYLLNHEFGHNFGLPHARLWQTTDGLVTGNGAFVEYGNPFDRMGIGKHAHLTHYNTRSKFLLGWLPESAVHTVSASGAYHLMPHDSREATGTRALQIPIDAEKSYWLERRTALQDNFELFNGALVYWAYAKDRHCDLLDMTPGSPAGALDAPLVLGRTFSDMQANIHITPTALSGENSEKLEITVNKGPFPNNRPPRVSLSFPPSEILRIREPITMLAEATDPDGDSLAYHWDFDDGEWDGGEWDGGAAASTVSHKFGRFLTYNVRCTVTDMKGGTATATTEVVILGRPRRIP